MLDPASERARVRGTDLGRDTHAATAGTRTRFYMVIDYHHIVESSHGEYTQDPPADALSRSLIVIVFGGARAGAIEHIIHTVFRFHGLSRLYRDRDPGAYANNFSEALLDD